MMQSFREFAERKVVRLLFALFLVIPFGLFGIDYYFKAPIGGDTVATVGGSRIGQTEFDNAIRRQGEQYRAQFGANFDSAMMENPEMKRAVLDRLVGERLLAVGAQGSGIRIGDQQLAERIKTEPAFHDPDGKFSRRNYEAIAKQEGLTTVGLDERLRESLRQGAYRDAIVETTFIPRATLDNFIRLSEQTREVSVVNFTPEPYLAKAKATPEQVKAFYEANKNDFTVPEQVRVEYVELSGDTLAAQAPVPAEDVKRVYEEQAKVGRWGQKEERKASHVLIAVKPDAPEADRKKAEAKAQAVAAEARKKGASFAEIAKRDSQDPGSAAQGGDLGFFARGAMVKPFEDAAFAAKKGDIVGPVASDFGYHVILVTDVRPERMKSLAEATPEIEADLKKGEAARKFAELAEPFANVVYEQPSSLKPAADLLKIPVRTSGWFPKAFANPPVLNNPKLLAEIFSDDAIKAKRNTTAIEVRPGVLVSARVIEHKAAELRPLEAVQADIERRLQRDEATKYAVAEGEAKLKDLQAGKEVADLKWPAVLAVNRQKPGGLLPPVLDAVLRADSKKLPAYVGVSTPAGFSLVRLSRVVDIEKIEDAKREGLATQLRAAVSAQELEASLASVRGRVGVTVRKDALDKKESDAAPQSSAPPARRGPPGKFGGGS